MTRAIKDGRSCALTRFICEKLDNNTLPQRFALLVVDRIMREVALRVLRSDGLRRGFPRPSSAGAARSSGSLLPGVTPSSSGPPPQAGDSTVEIFRGFGSQLFGVSLLGSRRTLVSLLQFKFCYYYGGDMVVWLQILSGRNSERTSFFRQFSSINESGNEPMKPQFFLYLDVFLVE